MRKNISNKAFTLIELVIAIALVSVVLLGIFSANMILNNNNQDFGQRYSVKSQTQTTLNHILSNASLAVGSAVPNDEGILIGLAQLNDANTFCIHQGPGSNILNNANEDMWLCYTWYPSTDPNYSYQIRYCTEQYTSGASDPRGASSCATGNLIVGTSVNYLGTAYSISNLNGNPSLPSFSANTFNTNQSLFTITIQNCLNDSASTCNNTGNSTDTTGNNPEVQLSGSVIPPQVST